jgi:predicted naringenin-chalcone synthase
MTVRKRCHVETSLAILAACLGVLTVSWPDWIEALTGLDPDAHNGCAEWLIVAGLGLVAAVCAVLARREYLRARPRAA